MQIGCATEERCLINASQMKICQMQD